METKKRNAQGVYSGGKMHTKRHQQRRECLYEKNRKASNANYIKEGIQLQNTLSHISYLLNQVTYAKNKRSMAKLDTVGHKVYEDKQKTTKGIAAQYGASRNQEKDEKQRPKRKATLSIVDG